MKVDYEKLKKYENIIHCDRPILDKHPSMDQMKRAAQFAPFAALTGYEQAIHETRKKSEELWEDEYEFHNA